MYDNAKEERWRKGEDTERGRVSQQKKKKGRSFYGDPIKGQ
jgi:hypothetical protein